MADKRVRNQAIPDPRWESVYDSRPLTGIMTLFPTLEGNQISSNEQQQQEQQQEDSDPYIRRSLRLPLIGTRGIQIFS